MVSIQDRLKRLEASSGTGKAERWQADMQRAHDVCAEGQRKLADIIKAKLAESGIDPNNLPPQTPEQCAQAEREVLDMLRAGITD